MSKSKYLNFNEYAANDHTYLMKALKGELSKPQSRIEFQDGTTYHVTKSGSRYWEKNGRTHREDGPASVYEHGHWYSLFGVTFEKDEYESAIVKLNFLRAETDNKIENLVEEIGKNMPWENRKKLWQSILKQSTNNTSDMLVSLNKLSIQYESLSKMADNFINTYS